MSIFEDTNPKLLKESLGQIHSREAGLPDFQRDFVWEPSATQELIVSIAANYPAGSLLRIRNTHNLFACREFQGAPQLNGYTPTFLVLDGQQRLTSLYQAFYGVGDHRYYLALGKLIEGKDFEESIFHLRRNVKRAKELESLDIQARDLILPLSVLYADAGGFSKWSRNVARKCTTDAERVALEDRLDEVERQWIQTIDAYAFPVVTLSDDTGADAVCTIFETLNRTGVKLSVFELLTARFWPKNIRLRDLWAKALADYPIIAKFEIDPYYVLQIVALVSAAGAPSCKRGDVLDMPPSAVTVWWDRAVQGLARGLTLLQDECGILLPKWLPYYTLLIPLVLQRHLIADRLSRATKASGTAGLEQQRCSVGAGPDFMGLDLPSVAAVLGAVLAKHGQPVGPQAAVNKEKVKRWFWCSVFGQAYENAPNTQAAKDTAEILRWLRGDAAPDSTSAFKFDPRVLRDSTPAQRAIYRGTIALILSREPRDLHTSDKITGVLMESQAVDDHHIFPSAYLQRQTSSVSERLRNCVLNRTLIDKYTNLRISDRAPSDYMQDIQGTFARSDVSPAMFRDLLHSHLIPAGPNSPLWTNDFEGFLAQRQAALWQEIERVTGATVPTDLVTEEASA